MTKPVTFGARAMLALLLVYFVITSAVSGFSFAVSQFEKYWFFLITLALGFGVQVGLYNHLKQKVKVSPGVVGATGATSTAAMVSCCSHYLVNLLPILGTVGIVTFISQYQIELFWVGIIFNLAGIVYMLRLNFKIQ